MAGGGVTETLEPLDKFPVGRMPAWVRDYVKAEAHVLQIDPTVITLSVLGATAIAIQGKAEIHVRGDWSEPLCIWIMTAMRSGNRKSPALFKPLAPVRDYEESATKARAAYRRMLQEHVAGFSGKGAAKRALPYREAEPPDLALYGSDATPEAIALALGKQNECFGIVSDEPASFEAIVVDGIYHNGKSNPAILMAGYSGSMYRRERVKGGSVHLVRPKVSLLFAAQPAVFANLAGQARLVDVGFIGRFLVARPQDRLGFRKVHSDGVPPEIADAYYLNMRAICEAPEVDPLPNVRVTLIPEDPEPWPVGPRGVRQLFLSPPARALHLRTEELIEPLLREGAPLGELSDVGAKLAGNIARVAGLLHVLEHPETWWKETVQLETMAAAVEIGRFVLGQVIAIFGEGAQERALEELADYVLLRARRLGANGANGNVGWDRLARSLVQGNGRGRIRDRDTLRSAVDLLVERGDLVRDLTSPRAERWRLAENAAPIPDAVQEEAETCPAQR